MLHLVDTGKVGVFVLFYSKGHTRSLGLKFLSGSSFTPLSYVHRVVVFIYLFYCLFMLQKTDVPHVVSVQQIENPWLKRYWCLLFVLNGQSWETVLTKGFSHKCKWCCCESVCVWRTELLLQNQNESTARNYTGLLWNVNLLTVSFYTKYWHHFINITHWKVNNYEQDNTLR